MPLVSGAIHFIAAFVMAISANWFGLIQWRKAANAHWTERARLLWPARVTAGMNILLIPTILHMAHQGFAEWRQWWVFDDVAAVIGALLGSYPFDREVFPKLDFRNWRYQVVVGWGLRFGIYIVLIAAIALMPQTFGWETLAIAGIYLAIHFAIQFGLFLRYLRWTKFAKPAGPRLQAIVNATVARMNVPVRATWQLGGIHALAFAFPTTGEMAFSDKFLEICDDEEVAVVCAHELAHLTEAKTVLAGRLIGSLALFPLIFIIPCINFFGAVGMLLPYACLFGIQKYSRWLSQRMEKRADQQAVGVQTNEGIYARVLEKIYRENQIPAVNINNRQTHPHLYDRMLAAGISPEYPRPRKPNRFTPVGWLYWIFFCAAIGIAVGRNVP